MRHLLLAAITVLTVLATAGTARAQTADVHDGFYLHLHIGPAYTRFTSDDVGLTVSGNGGSFDLALGAAVKPNLIIYGELFDDIAVGPHVEYGGIGGNASDDTSAGVVGVGVGVAYYFMPVNFYVAGALTAARLTIDDGDSRGQSDFGPGVSLKAGKEWMVSSKWGLGIGAQLFFGTMDEQDTDQITYSASAAALVFSVTYN
jgi:hypothetical protein